MMRTPRQERKKSWLPMAIGILPSVSADGKWVVFTREAQRLSDIYRIHPDETGEERTNR